MIRLSEGIFFDASTKLLKNQECTSFILIAHKYSSPARTAGGGEHYAVLVAVDGLAPSDCPICCSTHRRVFAACKLVRQGALVRLGSILPRPKAYDPTH